LTTESYIVISIGVNETLGSTGLSASITKSVIVIPVGIFQYASLKEFGDRAASRMPC
jgi:hypothetical protein